MITTGKGRQVPAGSGNKENVYPKAVTGFLGKSSSRGGGVGTGPHVPRSAWEARQVAMAWLHVHVRPVSKDHSHAGEERDKEAAGETPAGLSRECFSFFPQR